MNVATRNLLSFSVRFVTVSYASQTCFHFFLSNEGELGEGNSKQKQAMILTLVIQWQRCRYFLSTFPRLENCRQVARDRLLKLHVSDEDIPRIFNLLTPCYDPVKSGTNKETHRAKVKLF